MSLFGELMIRSVFSVAVFLSFIVNQSPFYWSAVYTDIMIYTGMLLLVTKAPKMIKGTAKLTDHGFLFLSTYIFSIVVYLQTWTGVHRYDVGTNLGITVFLADNVVPFLNYRRILAWLFHELVQPVIYLLNWIRILDISYRRVLSYLLYLTIHAFVLLYILDVILVFISTYTERIATENFFYTYDNNRAGIYPNGYLDNVNVNGSDYESPVRYITVFYLDGSDKCETYETDIVSVVHDNNGAQLPYFYQIIYRYVGEDLILKCSFLYNRKELSGVDVYWNVDRKRLYNNSRVFIKTEIGPLNADGFSPLTTELHIKYISEQEFVIYNLKFIFFDAIAEKHLREIRTIIGVYDVRQFAKQILLVKNEVGHLFATSSMFLYRYNGDVEDVFMYYSVNGEDIDQACPGLSTTVCSIGAGYLIGFQYLIESKLHEYLEYLYLSDFGLDRLFPILKVEHFIDDLVRINAIYCLCGNAFGMHRITIVRKIHLNNGKCIMREIVHPIAVVLLPYPSRSAFGLYHNRHIYKEIEDMVKSNENISNIASKVKELHIFTETMENSQLYIANVVQILTIVIVLMFFINLLQFIVGKYAKYCIRIPALYFIHRASLQMNQLAIRHFQHDVYLSTAELENKFVADTLIPYLETECHQRVYCPQRDILGNKNEISACIKHMKASQKIIVLLSAGYDEEKLCKKLQLKRLILPSLMYGERSFEDVLFILYDREARLPGVLRGNRNVRSLDWTTLQSERGKLATIKRWIEIGSI